MQLKSSDKEVRLDQLTEEIRALPGLSRLQGLSASIDQVAGEVEIRVHVEAPALTTEEERAIAEAVARHVPDPQWGVSEEEKELAAILSRGRGQPGPRGRREGAAGAGADARSSTAGDASRGADNRRE